MADCMLSGCQDFFIDTVKGLKLFSAKICISIKDENTGGMSVFSSWKYSCTEQLHCMSNDLNAYNCICSRLVNKLASVSSQDAVNNVDKKLIYEYYVISTKLNTVDYASLMKKKKNC